MAKLALRHCTPLKKGTTPISEAIAQSLLSQLNPGWQLSNNAIVRKFEFKNFQQTVSFVNAIAWMAEHEDHHPELEVNSKQCKVTYTSHAANGLTVNDFICAAKIDALLTRPQANDSPDKSKPEATAKPVKKAAQSAKAQAALEFDAAEADALLQHTPQAETASHHTVDDEDEFELIEPEPPAVEPPPQTAQTAKAAEQTPDQTKAAQPAAKTAGQKPLPPQSRPTADSELDLMATMILPPGMLPVPPGTAAQDEEDSTLILPPNKPVMAAQQSKPAATPVKASTDPSHAALQKQMQATAKHKVQDPDEVRTVILATTDLDATINPDELTAKPSGAESIDTQPKEQQVEKTVAMDEKPYQAPKSRPEPEIEADETLVMHVNTYKSVHKKSDH